MEHNVPAVYDVFAAVNNGFAKKFILYIEIFTSSFIAFCNKSFTTSAPSSLASSTWAEHYSKTPEWREQG